MASDRDALVAATARLAEVRRQVRTAQRQRWHAHAVEAKLNTGKWKPRSVAICLYLMENAGVQHALAFLWKHSTSYNGRQKSAQEVDLERWSRAATVEPCAGHPLHPTTAAGKAALQMAHDFVNEYCLVHWVRDQNISKGLTPSGKHTVERYLKLNLSTQVAPDACIFPKTSRGRGKWVRRWSARWDVRRGQFKPGELLSTEQRRKKVRP